MSTQEFFDKYHFSTHVPVEELLKTFDRQMDEGLSANPSPSSLAMLPAFIDTSRKVPAEKRIIVLDAGGTNLRVAVVWFDQCGKPHIEDFRKYAMPGTTGEALTAEQFFDTFAGFLEPVCDRADAVGFCFSYPTEIFPDLDGKLLRWSKQVNAPEVVGTLVGSGISAALEKRTGRRLAIRVLNDTTATLLAGMSAGMSRRYSGYVGFILGTGTNIAYIEQNDRIKKVPGLDKGGSMIINVESGCFDGFSRSEFDFDVSRALRDPNEGIYEKMISGAYIGTTGLMMLRRAAQEGLFSKDCADGILSWKELTTIDFDRFTYNPYIDGPFAKLKMTEEDRSLMRELSEALFIRAAELTVANISMAVIRCGKGHDPMHPVCITIDGSTYYKTVSAMFRSRVEEGLRKVLGARGIYFDTICVEDAPMIGSAIAGLIA